jgi:hypothetical protein
VECVEFVIRTTRLSEFARGKEEAGFSVQFNFVY